MEQNKILEYIRKDTKKDFLEEERRLFYVALTRAKNNVYLFAPRLKSSIFVKELIKNYKNDIEVNFLVQYKHYHYKFYNQIVLPSLRRLIQCQIYFWQRHQCQ